MGDIVWLHDGRVIYDWPESQASNVCNYWIMRLDPRTGRRTEEPRRLTNWPNFCVSSGSVTDNDKRLTFASWSGFFTTYVAHLDPGGTRARDARHFTLNDSNDYVVDWTKDSKTIIIAQHRGDSWGLYKQSLDSETPEQIIQPGPRGWLTGVMSPDDKWIIGNVWAGPSESSSPVRMTIVRIWFSGGAPETVLELSRPAQVSCARPPSTTCVIVEESDDHKQEVVSSFDPIKGRGPELARFVQHQPVDSSEENLIITISPDGSRLGVAQSAEGSIEIYSQHAQLISKIPARNLGKIIGLSWAADQNGFFVTRKVQGGTELLHVDLRGRVASLRKCLGQACSGLPSPDGRFVAIIERKQTMNMWMMENF